MLTASSELIEHVYIHIPFCLKKCDYCNFYSEEVTDQLLQKYTLSLLQEIELFQDKFLLQPVTIYFGGGTPSLLKPDQINKILAAFDKSYTKEITLEANPLNVSKSLAQEWKKAGINRISLGAQSFIDKELKLLGRLHEKHHIITAWQLLTAAGFSNVSLDLIYGLPYQELEEVEFSLREVIKLSPRHISIYCLSLDSSVPLYSIRKDLPTDEIIADFYEQIRTELASSGYHHYEISNFAHPGFESRHNNAYWSDKSYIGLGPSAAGYLELRDVAGRSNKVRYTNPSDLDEYFKHLDQKSIINAPTSLSFEDHRKEYIFLNLRKTEGLNLAEFKNLFGMDLVTEFDDQISELLELEMIEIKSGFLRLKPQAYFVSNEIFNRFV